MKNVYVKIFIDASEEELTDWFKYNTNEEVIETGGLKVRKPGKYMMVSFVQVSAKRWSRDDIKYIPCTQTTILYTEAPPKPEEQRDKK